MKKKLFSIAMASALVVTGAVCLTACGPDHIDFDMFDKEYAIGSNQVGTILYDNVSEDERQTLTNWEQWVIDNAANISYNSEASFNATEFINEIKSTNFIANVQVQVRSIEESGNPRLGSLNISGSGIDTMVFDFEAQEDEEYPGNYSYGNIKYLGQNVGFLSLTTSWDAIVKGIRINYYYNENYYTNYVERNLQLNGQNLTLRVGYDLLSVNAID